MRVSLEYFQQRVLQRYASTLQIWALGVGTVISAMFFGWNFGLQHGFWNMFVAVAAVAVMYTGVVLCVVELSGLSRQTGGAYVFARMALGPWGGFLAGLGENMEYMLGSATMVAGIAAMVQGLIPGFKEPLCWAVLLLAFGGLGLLGVKLSFRVLMALLVVALTTLAVFFGSAISHLDFNKWATGDDTSLDVFKVLLAIPYALWFFLGLEGVPLATEETIDPARAIPTGAMAGIVTITLLVFSTLVINTSVYPGSSGLADSDAPLTTALKPIWGEGWCLTVFTIAGMTGLLTSLDGCLYAIQRQIYTLARTGYFPRVLSKVTKTKAPHVAIITTGVLIWLFCFATSLIKEDSAASEILLNMTNFGALISYIMQLSSFIILRIRSPNAARSFKNPVGVWGTGVVLVMVVIALAALFLDPAKRLAMLGVVVWYAVGVAYFFFHSRHHCLDEDLEAFLALSTPLNNSTTKGSTEPVERSESKHPPLL